MLVRVLCACQHRWHVVTAYGHRTSSFEALDAVVVPSKSSDLSINEPSPRPHLASSIKLVVQKININGR